MLLGSLTITGTLLKDWQGFRDAIARQSDVAPPVALNQRNASGSTSGEISDVGRLSPAYLVNLATQKEGIDSVGLIGLGDEEFTVFDTQDLFSVNRNSIEEQHRLSEKEHILLGTDFPRYQTQVFRVTPNSIIELSNGRPTTIRTEDPAGWIAGKAMKTHLRFLYILSPENNQIYKYERLSDRYGAPDSYNINGELNDALDFAIDGDVYVLEQGGVVQKLLRGEVQPFAIRHLPDGALETATKVYKVPGGHLYFLDPENTRIVVATDGGATGEAAYVRQFIFDAKKIEELKDIWVDELESNLYVLDKTRLYKINLQ